MVVAEAEGKRGRIAVEERGSRRVLLIDGVVQGGTPTGDPAVDPTDPLIALVSRIGRSEGRALLIGLGTGRTATQLAKSHALDVVEIEPKVIEYAKAHFGYSGEATEGDGAQFLRDTSSAYSLIVLDAFDGTNPPAELIARPTLARAKQRLLSGGVIAVRLVGRPNSSTIDEIRKGLSPLDVRVFGTGIGSETQNLYLVASRERIYFDEFESPAVRQVYPTPGELYEDTEVAGYLVRIRHTGDLAIDLPHEEMGAQRFLITGDLAKELAQKLPGSAKIVRAGDEDEKDEERVDRLTAQNLAGGVGVLRSDLHYSSVVVGVRGKAKFLARIHPDTAMKVPARVRKQAAWRLRRNVPPDEPRIPYGGTLYELDVTAIHGVFTKRDWDRIRKGQLRHPLRRAVSRAKAGDLAAVHTELVAYLAEFDEAFGTVAPMLAARAGIADYVKLLTPYAKAQPAEGMPKGRACERLSGAGVWRPGDAPKLVDPLVNCAIAQYELVAASTDARKARKARVRLMELLRAEADRLDDEDPGRAARLRKKSNKLRKKLGPPV